MTSTTEQPVTAPAVTAEPKPAKKANAGKHARHVAPSKPKPVYFRLRKLRDSESV